MSRIGHFLLFSEVEWNWDFIKKWICVFKALRLGGSPQGVFMTILWLLTIIVQNRKLIIFSKHISIVHLSSILL